MPPSTLDEVVYIKELFFNFSEENAEVNLIPVVLDATVEFSKKYSAEVTSHPVGDKTNRADNYRVDPPTISFSGVISNLDVGLYSWAYNSIPLDARETVEGTEFNRQSATGILNRAQQYVERLEEILRYKKLVEIRIPNGLSTTNCMITSLDITKRDSTGDAFEISITAKQLNIVSTAIISEPTLIILEKEKDVGASTTIPPKTEDFTRVQAENIIPDPNIHINDKLGAVQKLVEENNG